MHAVEVAKGLGMTQVIVPPVPGVCSAFGLTCADIERHYARAFYRPLEVPVLDELNLTFERMIDEAIASVEVWGGHQKITPHLDKLVDIGYEGQSWELSIPVPEGKLGPAELVKAIADFEAEHEKTYGHYLPGYTVRAVALRLVATIPTKRVTVSTITGGSSKVKAKAQSERRKAYWGKQYGFIDTPVLKLEQVGQNPIEGPILVDCYDTTIVISPNATIATGDWGNLIVNIKSGVS